MDLKPVDIRNRKFRTAMRGYATEEVDEFLGQVAGTLEAALQEADRLGREVARLEALNAGFQKTEEAIKSALVLAQQAAEDTRVSARQQAEQIVARARQEADDERARLAEVRAQRTQLTAELRALLESFLASLSEREGGTNG